jgi:transcriptional regulator with XRE-family HTH domain
MRAMKFAHSLTYHRERAGLNMSQLAERIGVTPEYISSVEKGAKPPSFDRCHQLADILAIKDDERRHFFALAFEERMNEDVRSFINAIKYFAE